MSDHTGMIGPNAIIQLGETFSARGTLDRAAAIYAKAGCLPFLANPPSTMVDEHHVHHLFTAATEMMDRAEAQSYLAEAGMRTGAYILKYRIPRFARSVLPLLPSSIALKILLKAISRHSWTFAGSGIFRVEPGKPTHISISNNSVATPLGCVWHVAVFNMLFAALIRSKPEIREVCCCGHGADCCRFEIRLP